MTGAEFGACTDGRAGCARPVRSGPDGLGEGDGLCEPVWGLVIGGQYSESVVGSSKATGSDSAVLSSAVAYGSGPSSTGVRVIGSSATG